jgi:thiol-disulfide isomerase/thioredoxin
VVALAVVGVVLAFAAYAASRGAAVDPSVTDSGDGVPRLGEEPPPTKTFALPPATLEGFDDGPAVNLVDFRGAPLVINFWATWCAPCVKEMPEFRDAAKDLEGTVVFLGVDVEDAPPNAEPFIERLEIDYPLAIDPRREFHRAVGNFGMPTTLLVDPEGIVRYRHTGPLTRAELRELLETYLDVPADA